MSRTSSNNITMVFMISSRFPSLFSVYRTYKIFNCFRTERDATRLDEYNRQTNTNQVCNRDLVANEYYIAQYCRLCLLCHRVVQHFEGDGTKFNWKRAQPYTPATAFQHEQVIMNLSKPENSIVCHIDVK